MGTWFNVYHCLINDNFLHNILDRNSIDDNLKGTNR